MNEQATPSLAKIYLRWAVFSSESWAAFGGIGLLCEHVACGRGGLNRWAGGGGRAERRRWVLAPLPTSLTESLLSTLQGDLPGSSL